MRTGVLAGTLLYLIIGRFVQITGLISETPFF